MNSGSSNTPAAQLAIVQGRPDPWPIRGIGRLPVELLAETFLCSVPTDYNDPLWATLGEGRRNIERVAAPFRLASVCRMWRDVALMHTPAIWSYICLPELTTWRFRADAERFLRILLERSRWAPLSVLLPWDAPKFRRPGEEAVPVPDSARKVFKALSEHAERWRRVEYQAPGGGLSGSILVHLFARATPLLTELHVSNINRLTQGSNPIIYVNTLKGLLPASPRLKVAQLGLEHFGFTTPVTSLVDLVVDSPLMHANLWEILRCTPNLKFLRLDCTFGRMGGDIWSDMHEEMSQKPVVLSSLVLLQVRSGLLSTTLARAAVYTRMPNLAELHIPHKMIWIPRHQARLTRFLHVNGSALSHLLISENHSFRFYEQYGDDSDWNAFWKGMSEEPSLAPKMTVLSLRDLVHIPNEGPGFLKFHEARMARRGPVSSFTVNWTWSLDGAFCRTYFLCKQLYSLKLSYDKWSFLYINAQAVMVTAKARPKRTGSSYLKPTINFSGGVSHPCYEFNPSYLTPTA